MATVDPKDADSQRGCCSRNLVEGRPPHLANPGPKISNNPPGWNCSYCELSNRPSLVIDIAVCLSGMRALNTVAEAVFLILHSLI
jgi:hypothetical protein